MNKIVFVLLFLPLLLVADFASQLSKEEREWLENQKEIRIGVMDNWEPFGFINHKGEAAGISVDVLSALNEKLGGKVKVLMSAWSEVYEHAKNGELQGVMDITPNAPREELFYFTTPYLQVPHAIVSRKKEKGFSSLQELEGKTIALEEGFFTNTYIKNTFPKIKIINYKSTSAALDALSRSLVDAYVGNRAVVTYKISKEFFDDIKIDAIDTTRKGSVLSLGIAKEYALFYSIAQKAMDDISKEEYNKIFAKWSNEKTPDTRVAQLRLSLSEEELQWLEEHPNIKFTGDPKYLPYEGFEESSTHVGMVADYLDIIEQRLEVSIQRVPSKSWNEALQKAKNGEVDIISEYVKTNDLQHTHMPTRSYIQSPIVIIKRKSKQQEFISNLSDLKNQKIAVVKDYGYLKPIFERHPALHFVEVEDVGMAFEGVAAGEYDAALASLSLASYTIQKEGLNNLAIVGKSDFDMELGFMVKKEWAIFAGILNKAFDSITQEEEQAIFKKWVDIEVKDPIDYELFFLLIALGGSIPLILFYWNYQLKREVSKKTSEISRLLRFFDEHVIASRTDLDGTITYVSKAFCSISGTSPKDLIGKNHRVSKHPESDPHIFKEMWETITSGKKWHGRVKNLKKDGGYYWVDSNIEQDYDEDGKLIGYLSIRHDITSQVELKNLSENLENLVVQRTKELEKAKIIAEEATKAKSDFLANMSHELRTPMNAIIGMAYLTLQTELNEKQQNYMQKIEKAAKNLLAIINDVLDFSKIEAGKMRLEERAFTLEDVLEDISDIFLFRVQEKGLELYLKVDDDVPSALMGDSMRLSQVFVNLVGNAVKFTQEGAISIHVQVLSQDERSAELRFEVHDTGIGIRQEKVQKLFTPFSQADSSTTRKYGGTGLGLSICKNIVTLMGGSIGVTSVEGEGSTFYFVVRLNIDDTEHKSALHAKKKGSLTGYEDMTPLFFGAKILLVEDNEQNQEIATEFLRKVYAQADIAQNGEEALQKLQENHYDAILMDCQMPVMDGYETTRRIRGEERFQTLPIIAMTANALNGDRERCLASGMDDYISKPLDVAKFYKTISKWIGATTSLDVASDAPTQSLEGFQEIAIVGVDMEQALGRTAGDEKLLLNQLKRFADSKGDFVAKITKALQENATEDAIREAHTLKGLCGNIGASSLFDKAQVLESVLKDKAVVAETSVLIEQIAHELDTLINAIQESLSHYEEKFTDTQIKEQKLLNKNLLLPMFEELENLLDDLDSEALKKSQNLANALQSCGYADEAQKLLECVNRFDFEAAQEELKQLAVFLEIKSC